MPHNKKARLGLKLLIGALLLAPATKALAQEHPEHPKSAPKAEMVKEVTKEMMAQAIGDYVEKDAKLKGGYFLVYDAKAQKPLVLTLEKVHQDKLSKLGNNSYFACSDFKAADGKTYDLDFFMKGTDSSLSISEVIIHKEDGKPRYNWYEEDGVWKRK